MAAPPKNEEPGTSNSTLLSHQDLVSKLDVVPVFHIVDLDTKSMIPNEDDLGIAPGASGCFYLDHQDALAALAILQACNPTLKLALQATPLGTAFALAEGWQQVPGDAALRLQASQAAVKSLPEPPDALPEPLRARFNPRIGPLPLLTIEGFHLQGGITPVFFSAHDLVAMWKRVAGKASLSEMPDVHCTDLRLLVARMLSEEGNRWDLVHFVAPLGCVEHAQALQERDVSIGEEPPPLLGS